MPTVGMVSLPVIWVASSAGTISITTAKAPASWTAIASWMVCSAASPRPCTRKPPRPLTLCGVKPDVGHHRDAGGGQGGDLVGDPLAALELDRVRAGLLQEPGRGRQRLRGTGLVAAERQVGHHQRVRGAAHHAADQRDQLVDRDRHGGVVAVDHVGRGIADQQHRDARPRRRRARWSSRRPSAWPTCGLRTSTSAGGGCAPWCGRTVGVATATVDSLFRHRCPSVSRLGRSSWPIRVPGFF